MYCGVVNEMKCDECNLDMKWFNDFPDSCRCCGTFYYKCLQCGAVKTKNYWGNRMKFISNFCLYFAVFATFWVVTLVFMDKASIYSWIVAILLAIITALFSIHYDGKHYEWLFCWHQILKWQGLESEILWKLQ